jgi:hypothetical protein
VSYLSIDSFCEDYLATKRVKNKVMTRLKKLSIFDKQLRAMRKQFPVKMKKVTYGGK